MQRCLSCLLSSPLLAPSLLLTLPRAQGRGLHVLPVPSAEAGSVQSYNNLWERVSGCHGILAFPGDVIDSQLLKEAGPSLVAVSVAGERHVPLSPSPLSPSRPRSVDHVDVASCTAAGVALCATDASLTAAASAEHALGLALALLRSTPAQDYAVRTAGVTCQPPGAGFGGSLLGASVGILGLGALGLAVAERLLAFGVASVCYLEGVDGSAAPGAGKALTPVASLPELVKKCDVLFLCLPKLSQKAIYCVDAAALSLAKPGLVIVNASYGSLVDEAAVALALADGKIGAYGADGFACDDVHVRGRPVSVHPALKTSAKTLLTPKIGAQVAATCQRVELEAARALAEAMDGRSPTGCVNGVAPRRAGVTAGAPAAAAASGLASYFWCF